MQPSRNPRGPGSFSPLPTPSSTAANPAGLSPATDQPQRPARTPPSRPRRGSPASSEDSNWAAMPSPLSINKARPPPLLPRLDPPPHSASAAAAALTTPTTTHAYPSFGGVSPGSAAAAATANATTNATTPSSSHNFSRPTPTLSTAAAAAATQRQIAAAAAAGPLPGPGGGSSGMASGSSAKANNVKSSTNATPGAAAGGSFRGGIGGGISGNGDTLRAVSPMMASTNNSNHASRHDGGGGGGGSTITSSFKPGHSRRHSQTAGLFDISLPSTSGGSSLSQVMRAQNQQSSMQQQQQQQQRPSTPQQAHTQRDMSTSQIAAQAAVLNHQNSAQVASKLTPQQQQQLQHAQQSKLNQQESQQQLHQHYVQQQQLQPQQPQQPQQSTYTQQHTRRRSQTVPVLSEVYVDSTPTYNDKRSSGSLAGPGALGVSGGPGVPGSTSNNANPLAPPILSLTEASAPRDNGFGAQSYHNGLLGSHTSAAAAAASVVFSRSGAAPPTPPKPASSPHSPKQPSSVQPPRQPPFPSLPLPPPAVPEKRAEKSKVKLFSRPGKISTKGDLNRDKPLPSPGKAAISSALASLQRANHSTTSLLDSSSSAHSFYSLGNSSAATIRAADSGLSSQVGLNGSGSGSTSGGGSGGGIGIVDSGGTGAGENGGGGMGRPLSFIEKDGREKEKEKKHHFLSRQKHKLRDKDDHHLPLSSAASNSRPTDPHAPSSLYNFSLPPSSPGPTSTTFKSMSGLDLRHGGRALREKKKEDKAAAAAAVAGGLASRGGSAAGGGMGADGSEFGGGEWPDGSSLGLGLGSAVGLAGAGGGVGGSGSVIAGGVGGGSGSGVGAGAGTGAWLYDAADAARYGGGNLSLDDAWPYLKAKLQVIFEGEDLRIPVEHLNRVVVLHIQLCIQRRSPNIILDDLRELLDTGFASLDRALRRTPEDRLIPALVELWLFTFTSILPYMQAVFLPLDLEFAGAGTLLTPEQARDFWGGVTTGSVSASTSGSAAAGPAPVSLSAVLDVRQLVLSSYRNTVILRRYDTLKTIFSRLSLEFLPQSLLTLGGAGGGSGSGGGVSRGSPTKAQASAAMPIPIQQRPGRSNSSLAAQAAMAHSFGSFGSLGSGGGGGTSPGGFGGDSVNGSGGGSNSNNGRPGTAGSFTSHGTTLAAGNNGSGSGRDSSLESRSRAISNVSFGSGSEPPPRPSFSSSAASAAGDRMLAMNGGVSGGGSVGGASMLTMSNGGGSASGSFLYSGSAGSGGLGSVREQNVEDSKQVTEMVGRMLQCMSVLAGVGVGGGGGGGGGEGGGGPVGDDGDKMVEELCRLLKLNWLGRGRTGRNRRGMVGGRVRRGGTGESAAVREGLGLA